MGAIHFSLDPNLVMALRKELPLTTFLETGTFHGDTLIEMAPRFEKLHSVELSKELWEESSKRLESFKHVSISLDDSPNFIEKLKTSLQNDSVLYWLDAHWCISDNTAGEDSQCPLVNEIQALEKLNNSSVIVIDDARLFLAPPPEPHEISHWPLFEQVNNALRALSDEHEITIVNDTIAFYPKQCRAAMIEYSAKYGADWLRLNVVKGFCLRDYEKVHDHELSRNKAIDEMEALVVEKKASLELQLKGLRDLEVHIITKHQDIKNEIVIKISKHFPRAVQQIIRDIIFSGLKIKSFIYKAYKGLTSPGANQ
jgi:hypothetical protein